MFYWTIFLLNKRLNLYSIVEIKTCFVCFRYFLFLNVKEMMTAIPPVCKAWTMPSPPQFCMFDSSQFKKDGRLNITEWERKNCPWWLDMQKGHCVEEEESLFRSHQKGEIGVSYSTSSHEDNSDGEQRQIDEEQIRLLEEQKKVQKSPVQPTKGGRPKFFKDVEGDFEIYRSSLYLCSCNIEVLNADHLYVLYFAGPRSKEDQIDVKRDKDAKIKEKTFKFVYIPLSSIDVVKVGGHKPSDVKVWCYDYIKLGKEILEGNFTEGYGVMKDYFNSLTSKPGIRNGKAARWSVNFCLIDLPTGANDPSFLSVDVPFWNHVTEDHVHYSLGVGASVIDDSGCIVVMCAPMHAGLIEKYSRVCKLDITCRLFFIHEGYCTSSKESQYFSQVSSTISKFSKSFSLNSK